MAPNPSESFNRSIIQSLARSTAFRRTASKPCRSHHFRRRSKARKALRHVSAGSSLGNAGFTPASHSSSKSKPAGTGRRGSAA